MRKFKLGIIGTGLATNILYWPQLKLLKHKIEITALANRRKSKALAFAKKAGVKTVCESGEELLKRSDVEAVLISLPIELNAAWVIKALKAGKHVLCEKPLALNSRQGRQARQAPPRNIKNPGWSARIISSCAHIVQARQWVRAGQDRQPQAPGSGASPYAR